MTKMKLVREETGDIFYFPSDKNTIKLGRNQACDLVFTSLHISRNHCQISRIPPHGNFVLKNNSASNYTFVDNVELKILDELAELSDGALIGLGVPSSLLCEAKQNRSYVFLRVCLEGNNNDAILPTQPVFKTEPQPEVETNMNPTNGSSWLKNSDSDSSDDFNSQRGTKRNRLLDLGNDKQCKKLKTGDIIDISSDDEPIFLNPPAFNRRSHTSKQQFGNEKLHSTGEGFPLKASSASKFLSPKRGTSKLRLVNQNRTLVQNVGTVSKAGPTEPAHIPKKSLAERVHHKKLSIEENPIVKGNLSNLLKVQCKVERIPSQAADSAHLRTELNTETNMGVYDKTPDRAQIIKKEVILPHPAKAGRLGFTSVYDNCFVQLNRVATPQVCGSEPTKITNRETSSQKTNRPQKSDEINLSTDPVNSVHESIDYPEPNSNCKCVKALSKVMKESQCNVNICNNKIDCKSIVNSDFTPANIKVERSNGDSEDENPAVMYSQISETILISSDEDETYNHSNTNLSHDSLTLMCSQEYDEDDLFPGEIMSQSGLLSTRIKTELEAESLIESGSAVATEDDAELPDISSWWPNLSQNFDSDDAELCSGREAKDHSLLGKQPKNETSMPANIIVIADSDEERSNIVEPTSVRRDLKKIIEKVSNKVVSKTKEIEPPEAIAFSKRRRSRDNSENSKTSQSRRRRSRDNSENRKTSQSRRRRSSESSSKRIVGSEGASLPSGSTDEENRIELKEKSTREHHKKKVRTPRLRDSLLKTHSISPYKAAYGNRNYHKIRSDDKPEIRNSSTVHEGTETKSAVSNISIIRRKQADVSRVPRGIAKDSGKSKIQQLLDIDLFSKASSRTSSKPKARKTIGGTSAKIRNDNHETKIKSSCNPISRQQLPPTLEPKREVPAPQIRTDSELAAKPKKSVRFAAEENLKQVKLIPHVAGVSRPFSPYEFVNKICLWNYDWLSTYQKTKEENKGRRINKLPPIVSGSLPTVLFYYSFHDYKNIFSNLMYLETWETLYREWRRINDRNLWFSSLVMYCRPFPIENGYTTLNVCCARVAILLNRSLQVNKQHPYIGCLVVVKHKVDGKAKNTIAYVDGMNKVNEIQPVPDHFRYASPQDADTTLYLDLIMAKNPFHDQTSSGNIVCIRSLCYIRPMFKTYEALCKLSDSKWGQHILMPKYSEVYAKCDGEVDYLVTKMRINNVQTKAVREIGLKCVCQPSTIGISLIHGPPGTGKTRTILALVVQIHMLLRGTDRRDNRVLLCTPSNAAIDILMTRLHKLNKDLNLVRVGVTNSMQEEVKPLSFDAKVKERYDRFVIDSLPNKSVVIQLQRLQADAKKAADQFEEGRLHKRPVCKLLEKNMVEAVRAAERLYNQCLNGYSSKQLGEFRNRARNEVLHSADVIATTLSSCASRTMEEFLRTREPKFACCIVDEAGQCKESELWLPLMLNVNKLVLVGDHKQLPATVLSAQAYDQSLQISFFERVYKCAAQQKDWAQSIYSLTLQYRMHEEILSWPSRHFYDGRLLTAVGVSKERSFSIKPYIVFDVKDSIELKRDGEISNELEACFIKDLFDVMDPYIKKLSVAVITPYQEQKKLLLNKLRNYAHPRMTINAVDTFQGQETDIVICSFVRANSGKNIGFVSDKQRLNVSLTRARKSCMVIGNLNAYRANQDWSALINDAHRRRVIQTICKERIPKKTLLKMLLVDV